MVKDVTTNHNINRSGKKIATNSTVSGMIDSGGSDKINAETERNDKSRDGKENEKLRNMKQRKLALFNLYRFCG